LETNNQIVYTNWDPCNDISMFGLTRLPFDEWQGDHTYLYALDYRYNLQYDKLKLGHNENVILLLDDTLEGYSLSSFKRVQRIVKEEKLPRVIYASSHLDAVQEYDKWLQNNTSNFYVYAMNGWYWRFRDWTIDCAEENKIDKTRWFCCLQNRHRYHRGAAMLYLNHLDLIEQGICTANYKNIKQIFDINRFSKESMLQKQLQLLENKLPMSADILYDGYNDRSSPMDLSSQIYDNTLINLVTETFYDTNAFNQVSEMFITEKTYKPFVAYQLPIIIGPQGIVKKLREIGFDMFDDIIDNSYDELDDKHRVFGAIDSLHKLMHNNIVNLNNSTRKRRIKNRKKYLKGMFKEKKIV